MAYADPPYPGKAWMYRDQPTYAGEVDHVALIASLRASYDGWALSTSERSLRHLLPLCPRDAYVAPWIKPGNGAPATYGKHNLWEPLIVVPGRRLRPGFRDWLFAHPARRGGTLVGRKPLAFVAWLFQQLGLLPSDELDDLYPGTGIVGRAWREANRAALSDASSPGLNDGSARAASDVSLLEPRRLARGRARR
ncbi:MAG TPA: hypothetical protein VHM19_22980 [Polyangiales bacterium]|nr:hypothetical protein [Polyangiales bacterium]